ncbi:hypothetical protein OG792_25825 [Micromonospora sp. NBC_01699]|uniref:hypothetical protein n=1 Tax=Micromonospora sp. NBC_01699 TaxID=2975984 RepID=UPI002E2D30D6|nr:hypothetical protein [Micromonospora sp. NBC_01699]
MPADVAVVGGEPPVMFADVVVVGGEPLVMFADLDVVVVVGEPPGYSDCHVR